VTNILAITLPTLMVLVGILLNRNDANRLDARMTALEASLRAEMMALESSVRAEMAALRAQFHNDVLMLLGSDKEQDMRITRLEQRAQ
jgi:hypothetical protein